MTRNPSTLLRCAMKTGCLIFALNQGISAVSAQTAALSPTAAGPSYADLADVGTVAPLVAKAQIVDAIPLSPKQGQDRPGDVRRVFVEAKVTGLIRGDNGIAPTVSFLYDAPLDTRGKLPKLRKRQVLLFAQPGSRPGQIQLVGPGAMVDWTAEREATVKSIVSELLAGGAAPRIDGVGDAFHVAGTVAGEGETQIFLKTETGDPVSLSIIRRPGQPPRWAVALGEIVDEAAAMPKPGSLLWYRLACGLPPALPAQSVRTLTVQDAEAARADYKLVLDSIGTCGRTAAAR
jgi:hypothetical protein